MRILFTTQPAHGHFRPLLPLARTLVGRGHDVRIGTSARFAEVVAREGFTPVAVGLDWLEGDESTIPEDRRAGPSIDTLEAFFAHQFVRMTAGDLARDVVTLAARWRPDCIVRETTEYGGLLAGQALGIPVSAVQVASPSLLDPSMLATVIDTLDEVRVDLGLTKDPAGDRLGQGEVASFAPAALHDPAVPLPQHLRTYRPDPYLSRSADLPELDGLGLERPLVYATLGTVFHTDFFVPFFPAVLDGVRDLPVDVVVSVGPSADPDALGPLPAHVLAASYVPQRAVLDRCAVAIFHGGFGTVLDAIEAAVPMIVVPLGADQHVNAASVVRLGIGSTIDEGDLDGAAVRREIERHLRDGGARERLVRLRAAWQRAPGPDAAAAAVERIAERLA